MFNHNEEHPSVSCGMMLRATQLFRGSTVLVSPFCLQLPEMVADLKNALSCTQKTTSSIQDSRGNDRLRRQDAAPKIQDMCSCEKAPRRSVQACSMGHPTIAGLGTWSQEPCEIGKLPCRQTVHACLPSTLLVIPELVSLMTDHPCRVHHWQYIKVCSYALTLRRVSSS